MPKGKKPVMVDDVAYRWRRGVLVAIPEKWLGQNLNSQTQRKRPSKGIGKLKKLTKAQHGSRIDKDTVKVLNSRSEPILRPRKYDPHHHEKNAPTIEEFDNDEN
jgi:hypothetical protein